MHSSAFAASSAPAWSAQALAGACDASGGTLFCAHQDTPGAEPALRGFAIARKMADEAEILTLAVAPNAQRRGVGRALVCALIAWARRCGVHAVFLEVAETAHPARALYATIGFQQVGTRIAYYRRAGRAGEDALVMRLALAASGEG